MVAALCSLISSAMSCEHVRANRIATKWGEVDKYQGYSESECWSQFVDDQVVGNNIYGPDCPLGDLQSCLVRTYWDPGPIIRTRIDALRKIRDNTDMTSLGEVHVPSYIQYQSNTKAASVLGTVRTTETVLLQTSMFPIDYGIIMHGCGVELHIR